MFTYLLINFFSISVPFIFSFHKKLQFHKTWFAFWPACFVAGGIFIAWDVLFTNWGVWGFNPVYLSGIEIINLPLGEWLFFICIPYACVFTYACLKKLIAKNYFQKAALPISIVLIVVLGGIGFLNLDKAYTATTFLGLSAFLVFLHLVIKPTYMGRFYFAYMILFFPFFIVNGILTGTGIEDQVVWYNDAENLGIRMGTIPVEDTFYGLLLILLNVVIYEAIIARKSVSV